MRASATAGAQMVLVPAGDFTMGQDGATPERGPRHVVTLDAFEIDRFEVTNERYKAFIDAGGYRNPVFWGSEGWNWVQRNRVTEPGFWRKPEWNDPLQPVVAVDWYEADAFCRFAGLRLPTEAEWEKAARGTDERAYPWGNKWDPANAKGPRASGTDKVGSHPAGASPYGLEDMAGNVREWVSDWYQRLYDVSPNAAKNPTGPASGSGKVFRGGSWGSANETAMQTSHRDFVTIGMPPPMRMHAVGFRCARSVAQK